VCGGQQLWSTIAIEGVTEESNTIAQVVMRSPTKQLRADVGKQMLTARVRWTERKKERKVRQGGRDTKKHDKTGLRETGPRLFGCISMSKATSVSTRKVSCWWIERGPVGHGN
jgi:DNA recombination-dependent growth factor C